MELADVIGSVGVTLILVAFLANLAGRMPGSSTVYQVLNAVGAGLACWSSVLVGFWPFVVLEGVWSLAALLALGRVGPFAQDTAH